MKSPMIRNLFPEELERYSDLEVLESAAGFYVGTTYANPDGFTEPGSRDSGYFATADEAQDFLDHVAGNDAGHLLRQHP